MGGVLIVYFDYYDCPVKTFRLVPPSVNHLGEIVIKGTLIIYSILGIYKVFVISFEV